MSEDYPLFYDDGFWYFWDETGTDFYGPYADKDTATRIMKSYCKEVLLIDQE